MTDATLEWPADVFALVGQRARPHPRLPVRGLPAARPPVAPARCRHLERHDLRRRRELGRLGRGARRAAAADLVADAWAVLREGASATLERHRRRAGLARLRGAADPARRQRRGLRGCGRARVDPVRDVRLPVPRTRRRAAGADRVAVPHPHPPAAGAAQGAHAARRDLLPVAVALPVPARSGRRRRLAQGAGPAVGAGPAAGQRPPDAVAAAGPPARLPAAVRVGPPGGERAVRRLRVRPDRGLRPRPGRARRCAAPSTRSTASTRSSSRRAACPSATSSRWRRCWPGTG